MIILPGSAVDIFRSEDLAEVVGTNAAVVEREARMAIARNIMTVV